MSKKYLYILSAIILVLYGSYVVYHHYNKPHKIISEQPADFRLSADEMMQEFDADENSAISKFLDKVIVIGANIKSINTSETGGDILVLEGSRSIVNCEMEENNISEKTPPEPGEKVFVKGLFIGYDDLLGELQLKKCTIMSSDFNKNP